MARNTRKSTSTTTVPTARQQARKVYMAAASEFASYASEIAEQVGLDAKATTQVLRKLEKRGLVHSHHVNGEARTTWQTDFDPENDNRDNWKSEASAAFKAAWPTGEKARLGGPKNPATGPRYTQAQLTKALKLRAQGKGRKDVAAAIGVKSPNYLARMLARMEAEQAKAAKPARKGKGRKPTTKAAA